MMARRWRLGSVCPYSGHRSAMTSPEGLRWQLTVACLISTAPCHEQPTPISHREPPSESRGAGHRERRPSKRINLSDRLLRRLPLASAGLVAALGLMMLVQGFVPRRTGNSPVAGSVSTANIGFGSRLRRVHRSCVRLGPAHKRRLIVTLLAEATLVMCSPLLRG